jgi:hypothetical protein
VAGTDGVDEDGGFREEQGLMVRGGLCQTQGSAEQRIESISTTFRSMSSDKLKRALMQLDNLVEDGELRAGYADRAKRLRIRITKRIKAK